MHYLQLKVMHRNDAINCKVMHRNDVINCILTCKPMKQQ